MHHALEDLLIIDIETVSQKPHFNQLPEEWQKLWELKTHNIMPPGETPESFYPKRAAILAEFGQVVCISMGYFRKEAEGYSFRVKSCSGHNEKELLQETNQTFSGLFNKKHYAFCGHNIREFDIPYLCRRLLINRVEIPKYLNFQGLKPWEVDLVDTLQLWKFGDIKHYTSLNLLAACMGVPSPKDDIDGSMVGDVFHIENNLPRIVEYCQKDVVTVARLMQAFKNQPLLTDNQVIIVTKDPAPL